MARPRFALALAATLVATPILATCCFAQDYPTRPVRILVPFGAGGPADVAARLLGNILQESFGQPFVIEDRPGAGGVIGTVEAAKAPIHEREAKINECEAARKDIGTPAGGVSSAESGLIRPRRFAA